MNAQVLAHMGKRIRTARKAAGLTQTELAEKLGLSYIAVNHYEKGIRGIHVSDLPLLAEVLQVPIPYFFDNDKDTAN